MAKKLLGELQLRLQFMKSEVDQMVSLVNRNGRIEEATLREELNRIREVVDGPREEELARQTVAFETRLEPVLSELKRLENERNARNRERRQDEAGKEQCTMLIKEIDNEKTKWKEERENKQRSYIEAKKEWESAAFEIKVVDSAATFEVLKTDLSVEDETGDNRNPQPVRPPMWMSSKAWCKWCCRCVDICCCCCCLCCKDEESKTLVHVPWCSTHRKIYAPTGLCVPEYGSAERRMDVALWVLHVTQFVGKCPKY